MRAPLVALAIAVGGVSLVPASAGAAAVDTNTAVGLYTFIPANGEANTLTINADATSYTFTDSVPISDSDGLCTQLNPNSLQCPRTQGATAMNRVRAELALSPALFPPPDTAPNTFRYNGPPPPGTATEPGLRVGTFFAATNDDIAGSSGNDLIQSFEGMDTVAGEGGDDELSGSGRPSTFSGGDGNDRILASGSDDQTILGGDGDDYLDGGDKMFGEGGNDTLHNNGDYGGLVGDLLDGGAGNDTLVEEGDSSDCPFTVADTNIGGPGQDAVYDDCGGEDVFKLKDGEPDKWHCAGITGKAELDPSDVLVAPKLLCLRGPHTELKGVRIKQDTAKLRFASDNPHAKFECKLDKKRFKGCKSPQKYKNLNEGKHKFRVRGVAGDLVGNTVKWRWKTDTTR